MSHLLHEYVADQLAGRLSDRRIVVWYDPRSEFTSFIAELSAEDGDDGLARAAVGGVETAIARFDGSMYAMRALVEPLVAGDDPDPLVVYLCGVERDSDSPLMELETGGSRWEPQLRQLARNALRKKYTDGVIDDLLGREHVTYDDIANASKTGGDEVPSVLRTILGGLTSEAQLASWLADPELDSSIGEKGAGEELRKLVSARLKLELEGDDVSKWRAIASRFVLAVEFRADLQAEPLSELESIAATTSETEQRARAIAGALRSAHHETYPAIADRVESELGLGADSVDPLTLGAIDTFRFEERALLRRCAELAQQGDYSRVLEIAEERQDSFWLADDVERQAQWKALRLAGALGLAAQDVDEALATAPQSVAAWIDTYADQWHQLDRAQRKLEAWLPKLDDEPDERAVAAVRHRYEEVLAKLASGYATALDSSGWATEGVLQQTSIFDDLVRPHTGRVAYFLVDAMRYEMGAELAERLRALGEVTIQPAAGVLPSITTTGMAALMPGASTAYDVVEDNGKLQAVVDGALLPDLKARRKHVTARVPSSVDLDLGEVLQLSKTKLSNKLGDTDLIVVRSQEIDFFGEGGFGFQARSVMDTVIDNLARAVRKLAAVGVDRAVIASDHGHLFAAEAKDDSMKIEAPGGEKVELHRRCWIGRGGATPGSCVRVAARSLGNDSDLDFVFPANCGVFRAGGDLAFHHGGPTLQEMVIPVITFRSSSVPEPTLGSAELSVAEVPVAITNRMFTVKVSLASLWGGDAPVLPILMSEGRQVGSVGMVLDAEHLPSGEVTLQQGVEATIGFMLSDDTVESLRIVVLDPATDAELYRSPADVPVLLGVV